MKGKLFAISGPSGVGKNSVLNRVMQLRDRVQYSVSATSRPMRPGEIDGKSYYFEEIVSPFLTCCHPHFLHQICEILKQWPFLN